MSYDQGPYLLDGCVLHPVICYMSSTFAASCDLWLHPLLMTQPSIPERTPKGLRLNHQVVASYLRS